MGEAELRADFEAAAAEELERAGTLDWRALAPQVPWGDVFGGFTPLGRPVSFERNYLWEEAPGGGIRVEVTVYESETYEDGARASRVIAAPASGAEE